MKTLYACGAAKALLILSGCAAGPSLLSGLPEDVHNTPGNLTYSTITVSVTAPGERASVVDVDGRGAAAKDGFKMMAAAPVGCLGAGMFAGLCYGAAPFFPIIAAVRAEDADIVQLELGAFEAQISAYGLPRRLRNRVMDRLTKEDLPVSVASPADSGAGPVSLVLAIHSLDAHHSGYKDGSLALTIRYVLELSDSNGQVLARRRDAAQLTFDKDQFQIRIYRDLDAYVESIAERAVNELLLEWSSAVSLSAVYPSLVKKRSIIGFGYVEWTPVDTLKPELRWQPADEIFSREELAGFEELTYDIEVFGYHYDAGYRRSTRIVVESARGLQSPQYAIGTELLACQRYYWTPRARVKHRGVFRTVSAADTFVLLTPGEDCRQHAWSLPIVGQAAN